LLLAVFHQSYAATLWIGPSIVWTKSGSTPSDTILAGKVVLTRSNGGVLYNTAMGESFPGTNSPIGTKWAFGSLSNYSTLTYQSMDSMRNGDLAALILNQPMVMHIIADDIYLSVTFTIWGQNGAGTVSYIRSTPAPIALTSPVDGAVFAAPADIKLAVTISQDGNSVTNVSFFANATALGSVSVPPFSLTASNLAAGAYVLTAVSSARGISATSAPVNVSIVTPTSISLSSPNVSNGFASFEYSANPGLAYVVEVSSDLNRWSPRQTNIAPADSVLFSEPATNAWRFYRVGRLPNP
jgi:hypothetical protein